MRNRKVLLIFPAFKERFYKKIATLDISGIIVDLEDSVSRKKKTEARRSISFFLNKYSIPSHIERIVRVNPITTPWGEEDLAEALKCNIDSILYPKAEEPKEIQRISFLLDEYETKLPLEKEVSLILAIETPKGVLNASSLIRSSKIVDAIVFGTEDFRSFFGIKREELVQQMPLLVYVFTYLSLVATRFEIQFIDGVYPFLKPEDESLSVLEKECQWTKSIGAVGKVALHPSQVPVIQKVFDEKWTPQEVNHLVKCMQKLKKSMEEEGLSVIKHDGQVFGPPFFRFIKVLKHQGYIQSEEIDNLLDWFEVAI